MLENTIQSALFYVFTYLSPLMFILMAILVGDRLIDFVKASIGWARGRRGY